MSLNFHYLNSQLRLLESYFPVIDLFNPLVSKANVGWHIAHSLKVINGVCAALKVSDPQNYRSQFNFKREIVFLLGSFPRGRIRAPKQVLPEGEVNLAHLITQLGKAKRNIAAFDSLDQNNYFDHPYLNQLNKIQAKRLLEVHSKHHLKIIKDILKESKHKEDVANTLNSN